MIRFATVVAATLLASAAALAQTPQSPAKALPSTGTHTEGEVKKVDKTSGKVTLKHGPIANLEMPPMTMVFRVKDPAMLDKVQAGDAVRFKAEKVEGNFTVTDIQPAK